MAPQRSNASEPHFVRSNDGTAIAYDKTGTGPPLILVAGAFSYRRYPAQLQLVDLLASQFTVYNYDRRGRGDSGDNQPYAIEREIEDLDALIQTAGGSAYVWGLSSGALLSLRAASAGLGISKLAVHEPPVVVDPSDRQPPADLGAVTAELVALGKRGAAVSYFMTEGMGAPGFVIPLLRIMPGVWSRLTAVAHTLPYDAEITGRYRTGAPLSADEWASVTIPAVVMAGTESPEWMGRGAAAVAAALPNASLITQKGLGHTKKLSAKAIAPVLTRFFTNTENAHHRSSAEKAARAA